eukprot:scaffold527_cov368-Prasinococcus_capsulatus_cf.AAC.27
MRRLVPRPSQLPHHPIWRMHTIYQMCSTELAHAPSGASRLERVLPRPSSSVSTQTQPRATLCAAHGSAAPVHRYEKGCGRVRSPPPTLSPASDCSLLRASRTGGDEYKRDAVRGGMRPHPLPQKWAPPAR